MFTAPGGGHVLGVAQQDLGIVITRAAPPPQAAHDRQSSRLGLPGTATIQGLPLSPKVHCRAHGAARTPRNTRAAVLSPGCGANPQLWAYGTACATNFPTPPGSTESIGKRDG